MYTPLAGPPTTPLPDAAIYEALGTEGVTRMIRDFYRNLGRSPIAHLFPTAEAELLAAADNSALFWVTICGGPPLYAEKHGPPMMRKRHFRFAITPDAREHWLACWEPIWAQAVEAYGFPAASLPGFRAWVESFSAWMVNAE